MMQSTDVEQTMIKRVPEAIRNLSRERAPQFYEITKKGLPPTAIESGQIWSTHSLVKLPGLPEIEADEPRLIVLLTGISNLSMGLEQVTAAPISLMTWAATDFDLLVPENESPLNYPFMVEVWNEVPVLKAHLRQYLGKLSERAVMALRGVHIARLVDEDIPLVLKGWVGFPLMGENDARIAFQQAEIAAVEYLANVATAAVFAEVTALAPTSNLELGSVKQRFEILPKLGSLADFLKGPKRALAASAPVGNDLIITHVDEEVEFTFELLVRRRESRVYLVVHDLSPNLEGQTGMVILVMQDGEIRSEPVKMHKGEEIQIGKFSYFDKDKVEKVIVEIEE